MTEPSNSPDSPASHKRRLRWYQFRLRTLLVFTTLVVGLLVAWRQLGEPYRRQRGTMKLVQDLGGEFQTAEAAAWQRALFGDDAQDITFVNLADSDEVDRYLRPIAELPRLRALAVGGLAFTAAHLRELRRCRSLEVLMLDSTSVRADDLAAWQRERPDVRVFESEGRAIVSLKQLGFNVIHRNVPDSGQRVPDGLIDDFYHRAIMVWGDSGTTADKALPYIACLTHLETLDLSDLPIDDSGLGQLRGLAQLEVLGLCRSGVSDAGLAVIGNLRTLKHLYLDGTSITDAGLTHLANLTNLVRLDLIGTSVTDAGLEHLRSLPSLGMLRLDSTRVTDAGLIELGHFPALGGVFARGNRITQAAKDKLQTALPECFICIE